MTVEKVWIGGLGRSFCDMIMPAVERELRVLSRHWTTHALRAGIAAAVMLGTLMMLPDENSATSGATLFNVLSWALLIICSASGVFLASDQLVLEKREGTLGLLFLANLRGIDVIAGKVAGIGISALYGLVAALPVMALTLLLGGVTFGEFVRVSLALANILFGSLVCGIWFSARSIHSGQAAAPNALKLIAFILGVPMLALAIPVPWAFVAFSPGAAFVMANQGGSFWPVLAISHLLGWAMLWLAGRQLERHWCDEEKPDSSPQSFLPSQAARSGPKDAQPSELPVSVPDGRNETLQPPSVSRGEFGKPEWLETDPVLWLIGDPERYRGPDRFVFSIGAVLVAYIGLFCAARGDILSCCTIWQVFSGVYLFFSQFWAITLSTRTLTLLRRSQMMELLICTPAGNRIVPAHLKMLRFVHGGPFLIVATGTLITLFIELAHPKGREAVPMVVMLGIGFGFAVPAVSCTAIWLTLTLRKPQSARIIVLLTLVLPQILCCSGGFLLALIMPVVFFIFRGLLKSDIRSLVRNEG
jgi:hypothetical protein